eukprot:m.467019 g.467019  ORF g.467019 m.467019 type:complete len:401 (+) comp21631_c0_seq7:562-1764(+)
MNKSDFDGIEVISTAAGTATKETTLQVFENFLSEIKDMRIQGQWWDETKPVLVVWDACNVHGYDRMQDLTVDSASKEIKDLAARLNAIFLPLQHNTSILYSPPDNGFFKMLKDRMSLLIWAITNTHDDKGLRIVWDETVSFVETIDPQDQIIPDAITRADGFRKETGDRTHVIAMVTLLKKFSWASLVRKAFAEACVFPYNRDKVIAKVCHEGEQNIASKTKAPTKPRTATVAYQKLSLVNKLTSPESITKYGSKNGLRSLVDICAQELQVVDMLANIMSKIEMTPEDSTRKHSKPKQQRMVKGTQATTAKQFAVERSKHVAAQKEKVAAKCRAQKEQKIESSKITATVSSAVTPLVTPKLNPETEAASACTTTGLLPSCKFFLFRFAHKQSPYHCSHPT